MRSKQDILHFLNVLVRAALLAAVITVFVVAGILFFRSFFSGLIPKFKGSLSGQPVRVAPPVNSESPRLSASTALQGSFTELFSGIGWKNEKTSDVYQDMKTTVISFAPSYSVEESPSLSAALNGEKIIAAKGNGKEVILVAESGKIFRFAGNNGPVTEIGKTNVSLKSAFLDYDDSTGGWVLAASTADGSTVLGSIGLIRPIGLIAQTSPAGLVCANGECLVLLAVSSSNPVGSKIYRFSESAEVELPKEVQLPDIDSSAGISNSPFSKGSTPQGGGISSISLGKAGDILLLGIVEKDGQEYTGSIFKYSSGAFSPVAEKLFSSKYPAPIRFGYDSQNKELLAVYAAYIGQAYLMKISNSQCPISNKFSNSNASNSLKIENCELKIAENYSQYFPQRVMDGQVEGEVEVDPELFFKDGVWWFGSAYDSKEPKVFRIENGVGNDLTEDVLSKLSCSSSSSCSKLFTVPGFATNQVYLIPSEVGLPAEVRLPNIGNGSNNRIYRLTSSGFALKPKAVWESLNLNPWDAGIVSARIFRADGGDYSPFPKGSTPQGGGISYSLSNNGGANWTPAKPGEVINFSTKGKDLRFKIEMSSSKDKSVTPWLDTFGVEYAAE